MIKEVHIYKISPSLLAEIERAVQEFSSFSYEFRSLSVGPDRSAGFIEMRGEIIPDTTGKPARMIGVIHDITDRKQTEMELRQYQTKLEGLVERRTTELRESEKKFRSMFENSLD